MQQEYYLQINSHSMLEHHAPYKLCVQCRSPRVSTNLQRPMTLWVLVAMRPQCWCSHPGGSLELPSAGSPWSQRSLDSLVENESLRHGCQHYGVPENKLQKYMIQNVKPMFYWLLFLLWLLKDQLHNLMSQNTLNYNKMLTLARYPLYWVQVLTKPAVIYPACTKL